MELDPANTTILNHFGNLLVQMGKADEGMVHLRRAIALEPEFALPWNSLGVALLGKDENDEAVRCFQKAIELAPKFADAHHNLGDARIAQNRTADAIACYREALANAPNDLITRNNLALALDRTGQIDEAMQHLRRALELDPANGPANLNLGRLLDHGGRLEEAIGFWRRAEATWRTANDDFGRRWHGKVQATLAEAESKLNAHQARLALARGERQSQDAQELVAAAALVALRSEYALAVRVYERAFAADAGLRATGSHRLDAAQSAAQAGCGLGADALALPAEERAQLRERARRWLGEERSRWQQELAAGGEQATSARATAERTASAVAFAGVRGEAALASLPPAEAAAWRELWAELGRLLRP
jgi:tetratricopeptide (TPR) repeat protein